MNSWILVIHLVSSLKMDFLLKCVHYRILIHVREKDHKEV